MWTPEFLPKKKKGLDFIKSRLTCSDPLNLSPCRTQCSHSKNPHEKDCEQAFLQTSNDDLKQEPFVLTHPLVSAKNADSFITWGFQRLLNFLFCRSYIFSFLSWLEWKAFCKVKILQGQGEKKKGGGKISIYQFLPIGNYSFLPLLLSKSVDEYFLLLSLCPLVAFFLPFLQTCYSSFLLYSPHIPPLFRLSSEEARACSLLQGALEDGQICHQAEYLGSGSACTMPFPNLKVFSGYNKWHSHWQPYRKAKDWVGQWILMFPS